MVDCVLIRRNIQLVVTTAGASSGRVQPKETPVPSLVRTVPAGILAAAIILSTAACSSPGSVRSGDSAKPAKSGTPAPLAGLTADQVLQKALKDLAAASSVRFSGTVPSPDGNIAIDIIDVAPANCKGTVVLTRSAASASTAAPPMFALIKVDGTAYAKYNQSFLENLHPPAWVFAALKGKYVKSTSSSALADLGKLCDLRDLASEFTQSDTGFITTGTATIDGQPALTLTQPNVTTPGTIDISDSATPEILRVEESANQGIFLNFSNFNAPVAIAAPPAADIYYGPKSLD
jgi:hypothetical protein